MGGPDYAGMPQITDDQRKELETKHGEIAVFGTKAGDFAFRSATEDEYERFNIEFADTANRTSSYRTLCMSCVVWPGREALEKLFAAKPGLIHKIGNEVLELTGVSSRELQKK